MYQDFLRRIHGQHMCHKRHRPQDITLPAISSASKKIPLTQLVLPWNIGANLRRHATLIRQFVKRDVLSRYRGSYLGVLWSLLRPLSMLATYTIVFGYIFQSKLGSRPNETKFDFTLALFCGLILFDFFAECLLRAPTLVLTNPNYVTKVVFPLEILPVMTVGAALVQLVISFIPLLIALLCAHGSIPLTALYLAGHIAAACRLVPGNHMASRQSRRVHPRYQFVRAGAHGDHHVRQRDFLLDQPVPPSSCPLCSTTRWPPSSTKPVTPCSGGCRRPGAGTGSSWRAALWR